MTRLDDHFLLTIVAMVPVAILGVAVPLGLWWLFEPSPLRVTYVAPTFVTEPVESREHAEEHAIHATVGGEVLYRYIEYCVERPFTGTARRAWVNDALVWNAPDVPTYLSREPGCRFANVAVAVPTSSPERTFDFVQTLDVPVNPIRTDHIEYPPIRLTILDGKK